MAEVGRFFDGQEWQIKTVSREFLGPDPKCLVCGKEPTAYWHGFGLLAICRSCAIKKLPLVIADAISGSNLADNLTARDFDSALIEINSVFWRGAAFALSGRAQPGYRDDDWPTDVDRDESGDDQPESDSLKLP